MQNIFFLNLIIHREQFANLSIIKCEKKITFFLCPNNLQKSRKLICYNKYVTHFLFL